VIAAILALGHFAHIGIEEISCDEHEGDGYSQKDLKKEACGSADSLVISPHERSLTVICSSFFLQIYLCVDGNHST
jgi:hypothetical protein